MTEFAAAISVRATRGHTGEALTAGAATQFMYAAAAIAAVTRFLAPLMSNLSVPLLEISAASWLAAFGGFVVCCGPMLARARHP